jgi:DNA-binding transcriptional ArsR family regulator
MMKDPPPEMLEMVAARFRALADETRLRIMMCLKQGECNVTDLCASTGVGQASVSKHLAVLRQAGLVQVRRDGTQAFYSIRDLTVLDICTLVCDGVLRTQQEINRALGIAPVPRTSRTGGSFAKKQEKRERTR